MARFEVGAAQVTACTEGQACGVWSDATWDYDPVIAPDGTRVAFLGEESPPGHYPTYDDLIAAGFTTRIYVAEGVFPGAAIRVVAELPWKVRARNLSWSPDGERLLFTARQLGTPVGASIYTKDREMYILDLLCDEGPVPIAPGVSVRNSAAWRFSKLVLPVVPVTVTNP